MPPLQYEKIRDSLISRGKPVQEAKRIAAATYNRDHKDNPVTRATPKEEHPAATARKAESERTLKALRRFK